MIEKILDCDFVNVQERIIITILKAIILDQKIIK